jgi:alpha-tubulin suppressor-like RCC1 family protein
MRKMDLVQYLVFLWILNSSIAYAQNMQISGGHRHTITLCQTGIVMHAGERNNNQDGTGVWSGNNLVLTNVPGIGGVGNLSNIQMVDAGSTHHTIALNNAGEVIAFGNDYACQLGQGSPVYPANPVYVKGIGGTGTLTGIRYIVGSSESSYAIRAFDGALIAWGNNSQGQIGIGTVTATVCNPTLVNAPLNSGVVQVDGGDNFALVLKSDGTVYAMGENFNGQLGIGNTTDQSSPQQVMIGPGVPLSNVISISCGDGASYAIRSDGTLWAWGHNGWGQLGLGNCTNVNYATQVVTGNQGHASGFLQNVKQVAGGNAHAVVVLNDGNVYTMGSDQYGQLGDGAIGGADACGTGVGAKFAPYRVSSLSNINGVSDGDYWSFAITATGNAYSWGQNNYGQLSINSTTNTATPTSMTMGACTVLPVSLLYFEATKTIGNTVSLSWATVMEENTIGFEIERSSDGLTFTKVGTVKAAGNSGSLENYGYMDFITASYNTVYYRLKMIDEDGSYTYSSVKLVSFDQVKNVVIYPNPVAQKSNFTISLFQETDSPVKLLMMDMAGKEVKDLLLPAFKGEYEISISTQEVSKGMYTLKIIHQDKVEDHKIVVQ